eukprot:superscaffoldBa00004296_g18618
MDKKSANGFQTKASEGGVQRKQLPYSVETPYGFHLDLDFLKYVDDIEKGNTIKRVHIQRRVKGPPKFSTLPRNFSLPGNGARPAPKEKDTTWSGTSTLGPKPKSRVTEVQQIFDFRAGEGGSSRGTTSQGYVSAKPRDEGTGARGADEKSVGIQSRPNLLRASSMPITLQQRKGSDSSSPDRIVGTPENGSTENIFRASPDITERRCLPQDRAGLHQQITVALKRVRELEEQVKTIPELKAQICSLREEREKLLLQLQAQAKAQVSTSSSTISQRPDAGTHTQPQGHRPPEGFNLALITQPSGGLEASEFVPTKPVTGKDKQVVTEKIAAAENAAVKTTAPVRPQRGQKPSSDQAQQPPTQLQAAPVRPHRGSIDTQAQQSEPEIKKQPQPQVQGQPQLEAQSPAQVSEPQVEPQSPSPSQVEDSTLAKRPPGGSSEKQSQSPQAETQGPAPCSREVQTPPKSIQAQSQSQTSSTRRNSKELKALQRGSSTSQPSSRGPGEAQTRPTRQGSTEVQPQSRKGSSETQPPHKDASDTQSLRRGSSETAQRRGSGEAQASRRDTGEAQPPRRGSSESPNSPAALGQVVTRLTGLLGEQWAQLGSSSGAQQTASPQESPSTQKQTAGKRAEAGKGASAKPAGKAIPAATTGKPAGKPGPSKMSSIQSQLVSSLSVLSAFYSPAQKAAAASKQQEQGLKSIMKKNGAADKQGNKGAKKNLKFVGVNGGYETTSSEESSGDEKSKVEAEEEDSSEPEEEKKKEPQPEEKPEEVADTQGKDAEVLLEGGGAAAAEKESERGLLDPETSQELLEEQAEGEKVDKGFIDACLYVKDRMEEVSSPDKEMRQVLVVLYQEWFKISSQKDSQADTVTLYLRQVGLTTPTLLPYVVNLTDGNGNMALHYSVSHSNFPVVKLLLDTGLCETDNVNKAGYTPVMLAALTAAESSDDLEVAQQLLKLGDVNARSRQTGQTALMLAVSHGRVAMVKLLLSCNADVNAQDCEGSTALMCASEHGHTNIVCLLLETGRCDTSLTDKNGQTAQSVAEGASHQDIVNLLKAHTEAPTSEPTSTTDLH